MYDDKVMCSKYSDIRPTWKVVWASSSPLLLPYFVSLLSKLNSFEALKDVTEWGMCRGESGGVTVHFVQKMEGGVWSTNRLLLSAQLLAHIYSGWSHHKKHNSVIGV